MPAYFSKSTDQIVRQALTKLSRTTTITSTGPGSIARSLIEIISDDIGAFYSTLDFNLNQSVVATATGRALDLIGALYNTKRKQLSDLAATNASMGAFYFYLTSPSGLNIVIPRGTRIETPGDETLGQVFSYVTTEEATIPAGRLRAYASIRPMFEDSIFTAGINTLTSHNYAAPGGVDVYCTNPKAISATTGYELDDDYRTRIIKSVRTTGGGTAEAVRFAALALPGVRDVRVRQAPYGLGTFEVLVVAEDYSVSLGMVDYVRTTLEAVRPVGVRMLVKRPELLHVDITAKVSLKSGLNITTEGVTRRVNNAILRYLNSLSVGDQLVYNQMISYILEATEVISDVTITSLSVNGKQILRTNYAPKEDEQIVPGTIDVSIS